MEGYGGWARPLDQQVLARGWRLFNVNNLKLARYKEIFPAPAKTDAIDARRMLELFAFDGQRPLVRNVLAEITTASQAQRQLKYLTRRRRHLVTERAARLTRLRVDLQAVCPDLLALTRAADNRWFLHWLTCRDRLTALPRLHAKTIAAIRLRRCQDRTPSSGHGRRRRLSGRISIYMITISSPTPRPFWIWMSNSADLNRRIEAAAADCPMASAFGPSPASVPRVPPNWPARSVTCVRFDHEASLALYLGMAPLDHSLRPDTARSAAQVRQQPLPERDDDLHGPTYAMRAGVAGLLRSQTRAGQTP